MPGWPLPSWVRLGLTQVRDHKLSPIIEGEHGKLSTLNHLKSSKLKIEDFFIILRPFLYFTLRSITNYILLRGGRGDKLVSYTPKDKAMNIA